MKPANTSLHWALIYGAGAALLAVALGAFAAHGLKSWLDVYSLGVFHTAVEYQMHHAIGLLVIGGLANQGYSSHWLKLSALTLLAGMVIFSGSLYILALSGVKWLGAITPIGGVGLLLGWSFLIVGLYRGRDSSLEINAAKNHV